MAVFYSSVVWFLLIGLAALGSVAAMADELKIRSGIEGVDGGGAIILPTGDKLCLPGVWVPISSAVDAGSISWQSAWLQELRRIRSLALIPSDHHDRYGCRLAEIGPAGGKSPQHVLIAAGLAAVDPTSTWIDDRIADELLLIEDEARHAKRGFWRHAAAHSVRAEELTGGFGTRRIVEGRVRRVSGNKRYLYLNFGADWRTDFTVRIERDLAESNGLDQRQLTGSRLRVRGVLQDSRGPLIAISHPKQIEFLP